MSAMHRPRRLRRRFQSERILWTGPGRSSDRLCKRFHRTYQKSKNLLISAVVKCLKSVAATADSHRCWPIKLYYHFMDSSLRENNAAALEKMKAILGPKKSARPIVIKDKVSIILQK